MVTNQKEPKECKGADRKQYKEKIIAGKHAERCASIGCVN
jgi:hypothetical protein